MLLTALQGETWKKVSLEEWRPNECYHISSEGRVISDKHRKRSLSFKFSNINGYEAFSAIRKNGSTHLVYVHKIVAELFLENNANKTYVIHLDHNKVNNNVNNLKWATRAEMINHNKSNPLVIKGKEKNKRLKPYSKLSEGKVKMIKRKLFDPNRRTRLRLIAKQFGVSEMQLHRIKTGENWGDVTDF